MPKALEDSSISGSTTLSNERLHTSLKPISGSPQAHFLGQYNKYYDKLERPSLNAGVYLDKELTYMLEEDRKSEEMMRHRRLKNHYR